MPKRRKIFNKSLIVSLLGFFAISFLSPIYAADQTCTTGAGNPGINTAVGCVPFTNPSDLVQTLLSWGIGIAGGISILLVVLAGFQIMTASGDPKKTAAGKELLTASFSGLALVVFSVFLLRLIGVSILQIL